MRRDFWRFAADFIGALLIFALPVAVIYIAFGLGL